MNFQTFLGVDLGASSGRVMAGHWDGRQLNIRELHRFANGPDPVREMKGSLHWDIHGLWKEIKTGLASGAERFGDSIVSVGVDSWGVDYALLDADRQLIDLPHHYRDTRTEGVMDEAFELMPRLGIFQATGIQFLPFNSIYQLLAMRRQDPKTLARAHHFMMIPDYLHWCLSGEISAEFTNATTTQLFDPVNRNWSTDLIGLFDLPSGIYPKILAPGTRIAGVRESVRSEIGLNGVEVIAPATHDTASAVAAVPTTLTGSDNWAYISSGTWSLVGVELTSPRLSSAVETANLTNEGGVDFTYRLLKNVMGLWLLQRCRSDFAKTGRDQEFEELNAAAAEAKPLVSLVDPDHPSFLNPPNMVEAIQEFCRETDQPVPQDEGAIIRCVLESLAFKYAHVIELLEKHGGCQIEVIHIVGGGSQNCLLNQLTAQACHRTVIAGPVEATAIGNVLVQAKGAGELSTLSEIREVVRNSFEVDEYEPAPDPTGSLAHARERFRKLLPSD